MSWAALRPLSCAQSVSSFDTTLIWLFSEPRPASMPLTRASSAGTPGTPSRMPSVSPALSLVDRYLPASMPPFRLSVATTDVFLFQAGMSLSMSTTLTPFLIALSSSFETAGLVGVIAIPFTPLATMS
jgi:hypothetical protein